MSNKTNLFAHFKSDFASGLVVFLVALPLCLGIAMASGAPLFSGIITGIVGGIVVGFLSQSNISVSGPAAGLTAIILTAITTLGSFDMLLTAILIAGVIQLALGLLRAGSISNYFPTNVIEGMLAGIGVIIIMKQLPHAFGYDANHEGEQTFVETTGDNTFSAILNIFNYFQLGAILIAAVSIGILIMWDKVPALKKLKLVPGALVAVTVGILMNEFFIASGSSLAIGKEHLVTLPIPSSFDEFKAIIVTPNLAGFLNPQVWVVGVTIAVVASIETLLCIEAADRMDVHKRYTNPNVELRAQGIGNIVCSLLGGLPLTSVVVRSSANNAAGAKSKLSTIIHGVLLLVCVLTIPFILNKIPLATLAAVLILVGYKLAKPATFKHFWSYGKYQFLPFIATFLGVVFTDLLKGVVLGIIISVIFVLRGNLKRAYSFRKNEYVDGDIIHIDLAQEVSFLNKAAIKITLAGIPKNSTVVIDAKDTVYIAHDILDLINEFKTTRAIDDNIKVKLIGFKKEYALENTNEIQNHVSIEHHYDFIKREIVEKKVVDRTFSE
ncbi:SulP family inorganic anion transporter [Flavobacterium sp.]|uniref:SulP family inorganic anion transporter n=1 Tax=Flavobacterium sp. TaxID=239 RepID=UPI002C5A95E6|nr:SulP family inorganic anion transporter [Flavobacterium sp.]HSD08394.1 SulP family inorganic anion transporter [Flavobacterium sp.]